MDIFIIYTSHVFGWQHLALPHILPFLGLNSRRDSKEVDNISNLWHVAILSREAIIGSLTHKGLEGVAAHSLEHMT